MWIHWLTPPPPALLGAALRVGEAYSLRWRDCYLLTLKDNDHTEAVHMWVLGKHSRGGRREEAYGMFGAVSAFKAMRAARPDAKPDDPLFTENHREEMKELLSKANLRGEDALSSGEVQRLFESPAGSQPVVSGRSGDSSECYTDF